MLNGAVVISEGELKLLGFLDKMRLGNGEISLVMLGAGKGLLLLIENGQLAAVFLVCRAKRVVWRYALYFLGIDLTVNYAPEKQAENPDYNGGA